MTRLYFHAATSALSNLPTTEQSSLTSIKDVDAQSVNRTMNTTIGTSQASLALTSNATTSLQRYYFTRFVSETLTGVSSITAQTWTYNFAASEPTGGALANYPIATTGPVRVVCYVWRPGTGKVGDILDGNSSTMSGEVAGTTNHVFLPLLAL